MESYRAAALDFSNSTGIKVYDDWGIPDWGTTPEKLQKAIIPICRDHNEKVVEYLYNRINKQFGLPAPINPLDKYHAVMGVVSQFNYDDIEYFMRTPYKMRDPYMKIREKNIENYFNTQMYWVPSPKTLTKIESHMNGQFQHTVRRYGYEHSMG